MEHISLRNMMKVKGDKNTHSTRSAACQLPGTPQGLLRSLEGYDKMSWSLWSCLSVRILRVS